MKRYMLFGGQTYYASGGAFDHVASFDDLYDAIAAGKRILEEYTVDWWHVYDQVDDIIADQSETQAH